MTIRDYIKIHSKQTQLIKIRIQPFSLFGKTRKELSDAQEKIYKKQKQMNSSHLGYEMWFFDLRKMANVIDFKTEIKKAHIGYDSCYSYDADIQITLYINDNAFIKAYPVFCKNY